MECPLYKKALEEPQDILWEGLLESYSYAEIHRQVYQLQKLFKKKGCLLGEKIGVSTANRHWTFLIFIVCIREGYIYFSMDIKAPKKWKTDILKEYPVHYLFGEGLEVCRPQICSKEEIEEALLKSEIPKEISFEWNGSSKIWVYTSGSTSKPKICQLSPKQLYASAISSGEIIPLVRGEAWELSLPLHHIGGLSILIRCILFGATITLRQSRGSIVSWVPTLLHRYLESGENRDIKAILIGGASCSTALINRALKRGLPIYYSYGMTEMASQVYTEKIFFEGKKIKKIGYILKHSQIKVNEQGIIYVRGESLFEGYVKGDGVILELEDGWFRTSDMGSLDLETCTLEVYGREDRVFISGGENIHPEYQEKKMMELFPEIEQLWFLPKKDREYGYVCVCFVEPFPKDTSKWINVLKKQFPPSMVPKEIFPIPREILTRGLKIRRRDLVKLLEGEG